MLMLYVPVLILCSSRNESKRCQTCKHSFYYLNESIAAAKLLLKSVVVCLSVVADAHRRRIKAGPWQDRFASRHNDISASSRRLARQSLANQQ